MGGEDRADVEVLESPLPLPGRSYGGPVQWYGGKANHTRGPRSLLPLIPWSQTYVEPYGGAASILCALKPRPVEIYNDVDERLISLFRCFQDPTAFAELRRRLEWTPTSRAEFVRGLKLLKDPNASLVDRGWATFTILNQAVSGKADTPGDWGYTRTKSARQQASRCSTWRSRLARLTEWADRLARVQIECREGIEVIEAYDSPDTVFYADPPYLSTSRRGTDRYEHEASSEEYHQRLLAALQAIAGAAVVTHYRCPLYDEVLAEWRLRTDNRHAYSMARVRNGSKAFGPGAATGMGRRQEGVWLSPRAVEMLEAQNASVRLEGM